MSEPHEEPLDRTRTSIKSTVLLAKGRLLAGRYRIDAPVGVGGMGLVYRAHDERLNIDIAVKVLRAEQAPDPAMLERFERELKLAREVSHRNVVRIHDIGQEDDLHFITMDLVEGRSLKQDLEEAGRLPPDRAAAIATEIAAGLEAAHARGVVHRDLKPANILLDGSDHAYISDFGIARSTTHTQLTRTGMIVGSPDYLAPEQASGSEVDARTDIFALGVILYEMLSGELPYRSGTLEESLAQRIAGRARDLNSTGVAVPAYLRQIVRRCLQRDPAQRYQSVAEVAADLTEARGPGFRMPRKVWRAAAGLAVVAVVAVPGWRFINTDRPAATTVQRLAILPLADETGDPALAWMASGVSEMIAADIAQTPSIEVVDQQRVASTISDLRLDPAALGSAEIAQLGEMLAAGRLVGGSIRRAGGQLRVDARLVNPLAPGTPELFSVEANERQVLTLINGLSAQVRRRLELAPATEQDSLTTSVEALQSYTEGLSALRRGDPLAATPLLEKAAGQDPAFSAAWMQLAAAYDQLGFSEEALVASQTAERTAGQSVSRSGLRARAQAAAFGGDFEASRALLTQLVELYPRDTETRVYLAESYGERGDYDRAAEILHAIVAEDANHPRAWYLLGKYSILAGDAARAVDEYLARAQVIQNRLDNRQGQADVLNAMGIAYQRIGQVDAAREHYERAAELRRGIGDKRGVSASLSNLARIEMLDGDYAAARRHLDEAVGLRRQIGDKAGLASLVNTVGTLEEEQGRYRAALDQFRDAMRIREELGDRRALAESLNNIGFAYFMLGELDNASVYWKRVLDESAALSNPDLEMQGLQSMGMLDTARGAWDAALKAFLRALEISRKLEFPEAEATSIGNLGHIAAIQGRYRAALSQYDEALAILEQLGDVRGLIEFGLTRAAMLAKLGDDRATTAIDGIEKYLEDSPIPEQRADLLRIRAHIALAAGDPVAAREALNQAVLAAEASGSILASMRAQLATVGPHLAAGEVDVALGIAQTVGEQARRTGYADLQLEALEALVRAHLRAGDTGAAADATTRLLTMLERYVPYGDAWRIHALAAEVFNAGGNVDAAAAQRAAANQELERVRGNLPAEVVDPFDARFPVKQITQQAVASGN